MYTCILVERYTNTDIIKSKFARMKWAIPTSSVDARIAPNGTILSALVKPMSRTVQNCKQLQVAPKRHTEKYSGQCTMSMFA